MKSWELSRNIIAFFESYPEIASRKFSFFSTVIANNYKIVKSFGSSFDNPELKNDPMEIIEEEIELFKAMKNSYISIELQTNIEYDTPKHVQIYDDFIGPMLQILANHVDIKEIRESMIDLLTLKGLYDAKSQTLIPDVVNTVIYV